MANSDQPRRACSCGATKRIPFHITLVATLVLVFLFFQDSLPGIPWPGKEGAEVLRFTYVRSWWQVQHGEELESMSLAIAKARESLRSLSPER